MKTGVGPRDVTGEVFKLTTQVLSGACVVVLYYE